MKKINRLLLSVLILLTSMLVAGNVSSMAKTAPPQGITVSPAYQQVSIPQGQTNVPIKFIVTNHETQSQTIKLSTQDFNTLGETGGLVFVGSNPTQLQKKYGLAKWLSLEQSQLTIKAEQTIAIKAKILNLPSLSPGGHYGALMLALNSGQNSGGVSLHPIASSLLFVTKIGGDTHKLSLVSVDAKHNIFSLPSNVVLRFHNNGNTHVVQRGIVKIEDAQDSIVSKGIINQNSGIILPESYRKINVTLQPISHAYGIGRYKLLVDYRFDGIDQYRRYQTSYWLFPWYYIAAIIGLLIAGVLTKLGYQNLRSWRK